MKLSQRTTTKSFAFLMSLLFILFAGNTELKAQNNTD